jgi:hypothetical protein
MNNSICTLFDNILIDIHKFKSLHRNKNLMSQLFDKIFYEIPILFVLYFCFYR